MPESRDIRRAGEPAGHAYDGYRWITRDALRLLRVSRGRRLVWLRHEEVVRGLG
ncbi:MAG: hypothetical protein OXI37_02555 [Gammaproteobacteria bacterium]|nr:hypothetical protein [Gammaproteobacteria bacterium]